MLTIDAKGVYYKELNQQIKKALKEGEESLELVNVNGQRYIGDGISGSQRIIVRGTPGNDLAAYMDGLELIIQGNAQDAIANTMNKGTIVVHGNAGDTVGYAMRGGKIFIKGNVGYRVGIHMKEYMDKVPAIVIGGSTGDFFGEYMAGGVMIVLGLEIGDKPIVGDYCGTGMHGGVIYLRGQVEDYKLGKEVKVVPLEEEDKIKISNYVEEFAGHFGYNAEEILAQQFIKLIPYNKRPYGNLYAGW